MIRLETSAYDFTLSQSNTPTEEMWIEVRVQLLLHDQFSGSLSAEVTSYMSMNDILGLAEYLEGYVREVRGAGDVDVSAAPFVPLNLAFELSAADGEATSDDEGDFVLATMLNVGTDSFGGRVYIGAKGGVKFTTTIAFTRELRQFVLSLEKRRD